MTAFVIGQFSIQSCTIRSLEHNPFKGVYWWAADISDGKLFHVSNIQWGKKRSNI